MSLSPTPRPWTLLQPIHSPPSSLPPTSPHSAVQYCLCQKSQISLTFWAVSRQQQLIPSCISGNALVWCIEPAGGDQHSGDYSESGSQPGAGGSYSAETSLASSLTVPQSATSPHFFPDKIDCSRIAAGCCKRQENKAAPR